MKASDLIKQLQEMSLSGDGNIILRDNDTGEYYEPKAISVGVARYAMWADGKTSIEFSNYSSVLQMSDAFMAKYGIKGYTIDEAILIT